MESYISRHWWQSCSIPEFRARMF